MCIYCFFSVILRDDTCTFSHLSSANGNTGQSFIYICFAFTLLKLLHVLQQLVSCLHFLLFLRLVNIAIVTV
jgi:hypothetical protein